MIIESAFSTLPETVAGYGFHKIVKEANAVGNFSFAILNALHGKNVLDPIRYLQLEKPYSTRSAPLPSGYNRKYSDIYIDYGGSRIGTSALANYGWRYRNYLEAKYLKSYRRTKAGQDTRASSNTAQIIADLFRLTCLVPEPDAIVQPGAARTSTARYFLCLADNPPCIFINKYISDLYGIFEDPSYLRGITIDFQKGKASKYLYKAVGASFNSLRLTIGRCTCFAHYPMNPNVQNALWMLLLRIDDFEVNANLNGATYTYSVGANRNIVQSSNIAYKTIRDFVATNIK